MDMKLLVAVDGSEEAEEAFTYATDIANAIEGSITVVHAINPDVYDLGGNEPIIGVSDADQRLIVQSVEDAEERGIDILNEMEDLTDQHDVTIETELVYGDPVRAISEYAEEYGFDTIVVGHRGRSERTAKMLGSTAKQLIERATIPVTVVR